MKIRVPDYFVKFRCIADKCLDSCCIGWEIPIDEDTKAKYSHIDGELGREIATKTQHGCFPLAENGRCAFLDNGGLCRIISALGDGYLCDICREHPRYYGVGSEGIEGGLGLACEEAARTILSLECLPKIIEIERDVHYSDTDTFAKVSAHFKEVLSKGIFESNPVEIISRYKAYAEIADEAAFRVSTTRQSVKIPKATYTLLEAEDIERLIDGMFSVLSECEYMSDELPRLLNLAKDVGTEDILKSLEKAKGLIYYFTHRYVREGVEDMSLGQRILFAILSSLTIIALSKVTVSDEPLVRAAVLFSKNIEYSTENVEMILDGLSEFL